MLSVLSCAPPPSSNLVPLLFPASRGRSPCALLFSWSWPATYPPDFSLLSTQTPPLPLTPPLHPPPNFTALDLNGTLPLHPLSRSVFFSDCFFCEGLEITLMRRLWKVPSSRPPRSTSRSTNRKCFLLSASEMYRVLAQPNSYGTHGDGARLISTLCQRMRQPPAVMTSVPSEKTRSRTS